MKTEEKFEELKKWVMTGYISLLAAAISNTREVNVYDIDLSSEKKFVTKHKKYLDLYIDYLRKNESKKSIRTLKRNIMENFLSVFMVNYNEEKDLRAFREEVGERLYFLEKYREFFSCDLDHFFINLSNFHSITEDFKKTGKLKDIVYPIVAFNMIRKYSTDYLNDEVVKYLENGYTGSALESMVCNKDVRMSSISFSSSLSEEVSNKFCFLMTKIFDEVLKIKEDKVFNGEFIKLVNIAIKKEKRVLIGQEETLVRYINTTSNEELLDFISNAKAKYPESVVNRINELIDLKRGEDKALFVSNVLEDSDEVVYKKKLRFPYKMKALVFETERVFELCSNNRMIYKSYDVINDEQYITFNIMSHEKITISGQEIVDFINEKLKVLEDKYLKMDMINDKDKILREIIDGLILRSKMKNIKPENDGHQKKKI